ncbi:syndecan-4 isoform X2 [Megalops cyprinoides]|uniref:syndecan-4 isoform X2 n=1 Tax=Megalops cyprinoides TaxID=118141 RepID=UPI0018645F3F|nr:syndecan-4 isoform X2 [Megalops cyprinoides]
MQKVWLLFVLFASVYAESVRETETWMPLTTQADDSQDDLLSSGDSPNGADFAFSDDEDYDDDDDDGDDFSGSGDGDETGFNNVMPSSKPDMNDNKIPEQERPAGPEPTVDENEIVRKNEVGLRAGMEPADVSSNVLMAHAGEESIFSKPEVLAALIAGGAVGLLFAILLILLLIYRMKKKDEGSYDLGKKPIYTKAPTTEIYA